MKTIVGWVGISVAIIVVGGAMAQSHPGLSEAKPPPAPQEVTVVNTSSEAVPVSGSISIGNQPTVTVGNQPTVTVASSPTTPVFVHSDDRPHQPFQKMFFLDADQAHSTSNPVDMQVPDGKRVVITNISGKAIVGNGGLAMFVVTGSDFGPATGITNEFYGARKIGPFTSSTELWTMNEQVLIYADSTSPRDTSLHFLFVHNISTGTLDEATLFVSGYLVDL